MDSGSELLHEPIPCIYLMWNYCYFNTQINIENVLSSPDSGSRLSQAECPLLHGSLPWQTDGWVGTLAHGHTLELPLAKRNIEMNCFLAIFSFQCPQEIFECCSIGELCLNLEAPHRVLYSTHTHAHVHAHTHTPPHTHTHTQRPSRAPIVR